MADLIKVRRDTEADWLAADPVLASGELGLVTDTGQLVAGDGVTAFSALQRFNAGELVAADITITPAGDIEATDVQAAIEELDAEKSGTGHNHDAAYVNEADHTKAAHDDLDIDAATLGGTPASGFASAHDAVVLALVFGTGDRMMGMGQ